MSWHFSRALEEAYSGANSSDGAPSAQSSGTPTQGTCWSPGKTTDALSRSRSGMTYRPSTDTHGEAVLTWCLAASLVRTSAPQEKAQASPEPVAACGRTWHASLARYDPASSSWKTHQFSLLGDLEPFLETWPRWGMMRNGECWELSTPAHRTSENASGSWPTPTRNDAVGAGYQRANGRHYFTLPGAVGATKHLPPEMEEKRMRTWATPTQADGMGGPGRSDKRTGGDNLRTQAGGSLNPTWVEWLMGWPLGWTDCAASVTGKFQQWRRSHGECSTL